MDKLDKHEQLCEYLNDLYAKKNHDYGDSVHDTYVKYGLTSFLVRMEDKLNRARTLSQNEALVNDEKLTDTLLDLANYAILAVIELDDSKEKDNEGGVIYEKRNTIEKNIKKKKNVFRRIIFYYKYRNTFN